MVKLIKIDEGEYHFDVHFIYQGVPFISKITKHMDDDLKQPCTKKYVEFIHSGLFELLNSFKMPNSKIAYCAKCCNDVHPYYDKNGSHCPVCEVI